MDRRLEERIARLAADRESGASELLEDAIRILREASADKAALHEAARALERAQPSMAPIWNAAAAARAGDLERFAQRLARAHEAVARFGTDLLETGIPAAKPIRIVTVSYSGTVAYVLEALVRRRTVQVACAEGRPACEGRRLAARLAAVGIHVRYYLDGAIGVALDQADAVLVGADAIASTWFLNKVGTGMLAAAAARSGVPVFVAAGREKFAGRAAAAALAIRNGARSEVWSGAPAGITPQNPYFEKVSLDLIGALITDGGVLSPTDVERVVKQLA